MENHQALDAAFHALSDPTRRAVLARLMTSSAPVGELAKPFEMGLPAFLKHLGVLEKSGLIATEKVGRTRTCRAEIGRLAEVEGWLAEQRALWRGRADRLADYVENEMMREDDNGGAAR